MLGESWKLLLTDTGCYPILQMRRPRLWEVYISQGSTVTLDWLNSAPVTSPADATTSLPVPLAGRATAVCPETPFPLGPCWEKSGAFVVLSPVTPPGDLEGAGVLHPSLSALAGWALRKFSPSVVTPGLACAFPTGGCLHGAYCELLEWGHNLPSKKPEHPTPHPSSDLEKGTLYYNGTKMVLVGTPLQI